jgi:septum formation protein
VGAAAPVSLSLKPTVSFQKKETSPWGAIINEKNASSSADIMKQKLTLASSSPRRKRLLLQAGLKFAVLAPDAKENISPTLPPRKYVEKLALKKALDVAGRVKGGLVIGADTILVCKGKKLGKPKDEKQAYMMLKLISNRKPAVYSGVAVVDSKTNKRVVDSEKTALTIRKLSDDEIRAYLRTTEPLDKAGAIAIQGLGAKFISRIDGSTTNVIGLPLECLRRCLKKFKVNLKSRAVSK